MRISLKWLRNYVDFTESPRDLAQRLTSIGLEVEAIEDLGLPFEKFFIGEVLEVRKHPNANKLVVCSVSLGSSQDAKEAQPLTIVCGAPNVASGQKVIVGLVGAVIPKNQHDPEGQPFTLTRATIRGQVSEGMICSEYELGLGDDKEGIKVLPADAPTGTSLINYLGLDDTVLEIGITPNRPDCLSHLGIAREVAAIYGTALKNPSADIPDSLLTKTKHKYTVDVQAVDHCPRYSARVIADVAIKPSPKWLQQVLEAVGLRPINNVVDATNYVMIACNQPLHAFDFEMISDHTIIVRRAKEGEKFVTLDDKERSLESTTLMICDGKHPIAIGGVMGGKNSEINNLTTTVLLESAYFSPSSIRRTSKLLGMSTDASQRFERGIDPASTVEALNRAAALIAQLSGGKVEDSYVDCYPNPIEPAVITLRPIRLNMLLGTSLTTAQMVKHLSSIGIHVQETADENLKCICPTWRPDLVEEIDLIEEVGRLFGYDNIEDKMIGLVNFSSCHSDVDLHADIRRWMEADGFHEIVTNSMLDVAIARKYSDQIVVVANPISKEMASLRPSMIPSMLETIAINSTRGMENLRFYELGKIYGHDKEMKNQTIPGYFEKSVISIGICGHREAVGWSSNKDEVDIFDIKGVVDRLSSKLALDKFRFIYYDGSSSLTDETIGLEINGTYVGFLGHVKEEFCKDYKIDFPVYFAELAVDEMFVQKNRHTKFEAFSKFPSVLRDLAFVVDSNVRIDQIGKQLQQSAQELLVSVTLFDVFEGGGLPKGKKSVAFSLRFNSPERTLSEGEIEKIIKRIVDDMGRSLNGVLRST